MKQGIHQVDADRAKVFAAALLSEREFIFRRVRFYDFFLSMTARISRSSLKDCIQESAIRLPYHNATWGAIDVPFDRVPEPLILAVGWHITPHTAFLIGADAMQTFPISCLLFTFTNGSSFECDAWVMKRKSKRHQWIDALRQRLHTEKGKVNAQSTHTHRSSGIND